MTRHIHHTEPGAAGSLPHQTPEHHGDTAASEGVRTAREGTHRQTGENTSPDPANEVADPHPSDEEHPYDARRPGGTTGAPSDVTRGRTDIGANPARHDGTAPPRPHNRGSGPE